MSLVSCSRSLLDLRIVSLLLIVSSVAGCESSAEETPTSESSHYRLTEEGFELNGVEYTDDYWLKLSAERRKQQLRPTYTPPTLLVRTVESESEPEPETQPQIVKLNERINLPVPGVRRSANVSYEKCAVSADGKIVAYVSDADGLVKDDTNNSADIFVRDRLKGTTSRVSISSDGTEANGDSAQPSISLNGRYVAFRSKATNLVEVNNTSEMGEAVYLHDRTTGEATLASPKDAWSLRSYAMSANGRFVLAMTDNGFNPTVTLFDARSGKLEELSLPSAFQGMVLVKPEAYSVSIDGRYLVFTSVEDGMSTKFLFIYDRHEKRLQTMVSTTNGKLPSSSIEQVTATPDARYIAFASSANNLVSKDTNNSSDIFVFDRIQNSIRRVSVSDSGGQSNADSEMPSISADGSRVSFVSLARNLVEGAESRNSSKYESAYFLRDLKSGKTTAAAHFADGEIAYESGVTATLSADGSTLVFMGDSRGYTSDYENVGNSFYAHRLQGSPRPMPSSIRDEAVEINPRKQLSVNPPEIDNPDAESGNLALVKRLESVFSARVNNAQTQAERLHPGLAEALSYSSGMSGRVDLELFSRQLHIAAEDGDVVARVISALLAEDKTNVKDEIDSAREGKQYLEQIKQLGSKKDILAGYALGLAAQYGIGVEPNANYAAKCYVWAARQGSVDALVSWADLIFAGDEADKKAACLAWQLAGKHGSAPAMFSLARAYMTGEGVVQNDEKAFHWMLQAAKRNFPNAQFNVGTFYATGRGTSPDLKAAYHWFSKAASQRDPEAQYNVAIEHQEGVIVEKDLKRAAYWFRKAAENGHLGAQFNLAFYLEHGLGGKQDIREAVSWYRSAADRGHTGALNNLALCIIEGRGIAQNYEEAIRLWTLSAERGSPAAMNNLGAIFFNGKVVPQDLPRARRLFSIAAEKGSEEARENLELLNGRRLSSTPAYIQPTYQRYQSNPYRPASTNNHKYDGEGWHRQQQQKQFQRRQTSPF